MSSFHQFHGSILAPWGPQQLRIPCDAPGHSGGATTQWRVLLLGVASSGKQLSEVMSWMSWMTLTMKIMK